LKYPARSVIRLDLIARGLLEIVEKKYSEFTIQRQWRQNTVLGLAERWVLLSEGIDQRYADSSYGYGSGPDNPLPRYSLHAGIARHLEPAGPAPWSIPPAAGIPEAITRRSPAEVALDLSRVFAYLVARGSVKARKDGSPAGPALRALEKAVPLDNGSDPRLPDPHGLYVDLLWYAGLILEQGSELVPDATAAARRFTRPDFQQIHSWARGWLSAPYWFDGSGTPEGRAALDSAGPVRTGREVLAWALGCLAHAGDRWYALDTFLERLDALHGPHSHFHLPSMELAWEPELAAARDKEKPSGEARLRAWWFSREGSWYANALMVSLVALQRPDGEPGGAGPGRARSAGPG
jgi:hypothetical protein